MARMARMAQRIKQQSILNYSTVNATMVKSAQIDVPSRKVNFANMTRLSQVTRIAPLPDIIPDYIKGGKSYVIGGTPGSGKTSIAYDMAMRVSTGLPFLGKPVIQGSVIIVCTELDALDIVDRLDQMGANLDNIYLIKAVEVQGNKKTKNGQKAELDFMLPLNMNTLQDCVTELATSDDPTVLACHLIIFDTFLSFLTDEVVRSKEKMTQEVMNPLKDLCIDTGASMILLAHFKATWTTNSNPDFYKVMDLPMPVLRIVQHAYMVQHDETTNDFSLLPMKHNAANDPIALTFRVHTNQIGKSRIIYPQFVNEEQDSTEMLKHKIMMFLFKKHCSSAIAVATAFRDYTRPVIAVTVEALVKDGHIKNTRFGCIDLTDGTRSDIENILLSQQATILIP